MWTIWKDFESVGYYSSWPKQCACQQAANEEFLFLRNSDPMNALHRVKDQPNPRLA